MKPQAKPPLSTSQVRIEVSSNVDQFDIVPQEEISAKSQTKIWLR